MVDFNPDEPVSKRYKMKDMIVSSVAAAQGIDNTPQSDQIVTNLRKLGAFFDVLEEAIGPFTLESVYRCPELQAALLGGAGGAKAAAQAATYSIHQEGTAADINLNDANTYFSDLYSRPDIAAQMGAIALKKSTIHFTLATPTRKAWFQIVDPHENYVHQTDDQMKIFVAANPPSGKTQEVSAVTAAAMDTAPAAQLSQVGLQDDADPYDNEGASDELADVDHSTAYSYYLYGLGVLAIMAIYFYKRKHRKG